MTCNLQGHKPSDSWLLSGAAPLLARVPSGRRPPTLSVSAWPAVHERRTGVVLQGAATLATRRSEFPSEQVLPPGPGDEVRDVLAVELRERGEFDDIDPALPRFTLRDVGLGNAQTLGDLDLRQAGGLTG